MNIRTRSSQPIVKRVRIGRHRRPRAEPDRVVRHGGTRSRRRRTIEPAAVQVDRRERLQLRIHPHLTAAIRQRRGIYRIQKRLRSGGRFDHRRIRVAPEHQPAPLPAVHVRASGIAVAPNGIVVVAREMDVVARRSQHLQRRACPRHQPARTTNFDVRGPQFQHRPGVDHYRRVPRNGEKLTIWKHIAIEVRSNQVRHRRRGCRPVAHDPNQNVPRNRIE